MRIYLKLSQFSIYCMRIYLTSLTIHDFGALANAANHYLLRTFEWHAIWHKFTFEIFDLHSPVLSLPKAEPLKFLCQNISAKINRRRVLWPFPYSPSFQKHFPIPNFDDTVYISRTLGLQYNHEKKGGEQAEESITVLLKRNWENIPNWKFRLSSGVVSLETFFHKIPYRV